MTGPSSWTSTRKRECLNIGYQICGMTVSSRTRIFTKTVTAQPSNFRAAIRLRRNFFPNVESRSTFFCPDQGFGKRVENNCSRFRNDCSRTRPCQQLSAMQLLEIPHGPPILNTGSPNAFMCARKGERHSPKEQTRSHGKVRGGLVRQQGSPEIDTRTPKVGSDCP